MLSPMPTSLLNRRSAIRNHENFTQFDYIPASRIMGWCGSRAAQRRSMQGARPHDFALLLDFGPRSAEEAPPWASPEYGT